MNGLRHEDHHHTPGQVRDALATAAELVEELQLADDLRTAAFTAAVNLLTAKSITIEQVQPGVPRMAIPRGR